MKWIVHSTWKLAGIWAHTNNLLIVPLEKWWCQTYVYWLLRLSCKYGTTCRYNHPDRNGMRVMFLFVVLKLGRVCIDHLKYPWEFLQQSIHLLQQWFILLWTQLLIWILELLIRLMLFIKLLIPDWFSHW